MKNEMERPDYGSEVIITPGESSKLWCTRMYLDKEGKNFHRLIELIQYYNLAVPEKFIFPTKFAAKSGSNKLHCPKCKSFQLQ